MWLICFTIVNMLHHRQDSDNVNPEFFFFFFFPHMAWEWNITVGSSRVLILWHADPSARSTIKVRPVTNDSNYPRLHLRSKILGDPKQTPWMQIKQKFCLQFHSHKKKNHPPLPSFIYISCTNTPFSSLVPSLGVTLDLTLTFRQHISNISKTAYFELRGIGSIPHDLSVDATKILVGSKTTKPGYSWGHQNLTTFLHFCMHFTCFLSIGESTTNFSSISFSSVTGTCPQNPADILKIYVPFHSFDPPLIIVCTKSFLPIQSQLAKVLFHSEAI